MEQNKKNNTEKRVQVRGSSVPADMIAMAVQNGADLDKLEKLLTLQERWDANQARKLYHQAMAQFKANPPKIDKDRQVKYKDVKYKHASLYNVTEKINAELSKHGLSAAWSTHQVNGTITVTCTITHEKGHSENTSLTASPDSTGSKNAIQAIGSTVSYLSRYTLLSLTGLATFEVDDDGQSANVKPINEAQTNQILDLLIVTHSSEQKFLAYVGAESVETMTEEQFQKGKVALEARHKKGEK